MAATEMSAGQVITGAWLSTTVTLNVQLVEPSELVAVATTLVNPIGNTLPGACE